MAALVGGVADADEGCGSVLNSAPMRPAAEALELLVRAALLEDAPWGDITSQTLVPADARVSAELRAREMACCAAKTSLRRR